jgi:glycerophosphoryl diester phosphodiesterase
MKTPMILAHRGLVTEYQENTLEALDAAIANRYCNGVEFDVFLTKDNKVVLFHDENMKRLTGVDRMINDMTYAELKTIQILPEIEVDGGMRKYKGPLHIPRLEDALELLKGKDAFIDLELKAYAPKWSKRKLGREVAKILKKADMMEQLACTSFNFFMLRDLENENRAAPSGFAYDDNMPLPLQKLNWLMEANIIGRFIHSNIVCAEHVLIDEDSVKKYHKRNMKVGTFTLYPLTPEEPPMEKLDFYSKEVRRLAKLGVDWIESDNPELVWKDLQSM